MTVTRKVRYMKSALTALAFALVYVAVYETTLRLSAQPTNVWHNVACNTNACIEKTLNGLSRSEEAKLVSWGPVTYVWYRQ